MIDQPSRPYGTLQPYSNVADDSHLVALYCPFIVSCHMIQHCLQVEGNAISRTV